MRLSTAQVEQTLTQVNAEVLPDGHPVRDQLNELFGDHTFFLDGNGLNILETVGASEADPKIGEVINLANWSDGTFAKLKVHEPEPTGVIVTLGAAN
jgi:hypothetical protein